MQFVSEDILEKADQGDMPAFEMIYKAASSFVYNVSLRIVDNKEDAQEVTQEVFLIVYHKLKEFRHDSSFKTWVYRITANCAINYAKKMQRSRYVEYDENKDTRQSLEPKQFETEDRNQKIDKLLSVLNAEQKACLVLRSIENLSYEEIAQALKININTVRTRLKRAREKLLAIGKKIDHE